MGTVRFGRDSKIRRISVTLSDESYCRDQALFVWLWRCA